MASSANNRILTKHSNRGFQIRKVPKITVEQERDLRDQLHHEIEQKTKACSNFVYDCSLPRVDGYDFCLKHILQDPKAPYKQCSYAYPRTNKRCQQPAPKRDVYTSLCFEHSRQTQLQLTRSKFGTFRNVETNETLLRDLAHRVDTERSAASATNKYVDPFGPSARVLNYASDDSDAETANGGAAAAEDDDVDVLDDSVSGAWNGQDMDQSDNESVDSQNEDFLKHAGIYTTEEATVITKSKMVRLQTLYSEQIYRLHHLLRQKRRSCLQNLRVERDSVNNTSTDKADVSAVLGGVNAVGASTANAAAVIVQPRKTQKQKALNQYLKKHGVEAVLQHKAAERRAAATGSLTPKLPSQQQQQQVAAGHAAQQSPINRCVFSEGGVKCGERGIPLTKYCRKHILEDRAQVLFKACGIEKSGVVCPEPVPITFENATCVLHFELPPQRAYTQKKYDSDEGSDDDDEVIAITSPPPPVAATNTTAGTPTVAVRSSTSASDRTAEKLDTEDIDTYPAASYIEQSADAMSPLCVSPMDMESDTEVGRR